MAEGCSGGKEESKSATVEERHSRRHGGFSDVVKPSMRAKRHRRFTMNSPNGVRRHPKIFNLPSKQAKETRLIWKQQSKRRAQAVMHRKRRLTMLVPPWGMKKSIVIDFDGNVCGCQHSWWSWRCCEKSIPCHFAISFGRVVKSDYLFEDSNTYGIETCHLVVASVRHHWVVA